MAADDELLETYLVEGEGRKKRNTLVESRRRPSLINRRLINDDPLEGKMVKDYFLTARIS